MGNYNTISGIISFAVKKGFKEVHFKPDSLPIFLDKSGNKKYLQGLIPINKEVYNEIKKSKLENKNENLIKIFSNNFIVYDFKEKIIFKHLPYVDYKDLDPFLYSLAYKKPGLISIYDRYIKNAEKYVYKIANYIVSEFEKNILIVENKKNFSLKNKKVNYIYNNQSDIETLIRLADQNISNIIIVPRVTKFSELEEINGTSNDKLIIFGTNIKENKILDKEKIIFFKNLELDKKEENIETKINFNKILNQLRG
jgi:hypothetical protein